MKLLVTGAAGITDELLENLKKDWDVRAHVMEKDPVEDAECYDAIVCNGLFLHTPIEKFSNLKLVHLTSAGLDRIPLDYVRSHGIELYNARGVYSGPMAEWAIANVLYEYKKIGVFAENQRQCRWEKHRDLRELEGKRAAIIGAGDVGRETARRFKAFGVRCDGFDVSVFDSDVFDEVKLLSEFSSREYDFVILTAPHTDDTHHLIDGTCMQEMPEGAMIIAMSRGGLVDEASLCDIAESRPDIKLVLDVFEEEPLGTESPLWGLDNVRVFPHNSFVGENNRKRLHKLIISNLRSSKVFNSAGNRL